MMRSFSCFKPRDPFRNWSKELDKRAAIWAKNFDSSYKLLLLGPAGAGKTTILKQMKIIHDGFSLEERQQKAIEIRSNLLESVRELTECIEASGHKINWHDKENQTRLDFINGLNNLDNQAYDLYAAQIYDYSERILTDKGVKELFNQLNQLSITHRSQYLLNRVDEIRNVNYIPNNDDILQSRRRTNDIQKLEFQAKVPVKTGTNIQQTFCMFDVGGQRGERRKWIQVFDGVTAVMFLIDSSSFDAIDDENGRNKLRETINLFHEVWTTRFLLNSNFVLLFNKQDILREKIKRGHRIEDHFPEYKHYKYQPQDRVLLSRAGEKLNLFRSGSSRASSRKSSTRSIVLSTSSSPPPGGTIREKRKSSFYRLTNISNPMATSRPVSPTNSNEPQSQSNQLSSSSANTATKPDSSPASSTKSVETEKFQLSADQAYLKARSFIRDKFLQVTRQVDHDLRKFSTPNIMYNSKGCVDQPKRQVCYHYTTATDTDNIRELFDNLQKMVIKSTMKDL